MAEFAYYVIRYTPNLIRDEWINVGVVLQEAANGKYRVRTIEDEPEFARLKRLHPAADESVVRGLGGFFESALREHKTELMAWTEKLNQSLSNAVELGSRTGLLGEDIDAEMERLYREKVEPVRARASAAERANSLSGIRTQAADVFRATGLWPKLARSIRVDEYTFRGDPSRLDFSYRKNGTRGFIQSLALGRDPSQAKVLAFTAEAIRAKIASTEFIAVTETEPQPDSNERHRFVEGLLGENGIPIVPLSKLPVWAHSMKAVIQ